MTVNRVVRVIAGLFIMLSLTLAHFNGQIDMSEMGWLWFTAFVGFNLFQSGLTTLCPMDNILKALGVKEGTGCA